MVNSEYFDEVVFCEGVALSEVHWDVVLREISPTNLPDAVSVKHGQCRIHDAHSLVVNTLDNYL